MFHEVRMIENLKLKENLGVLKFQKNNRILMVNYFSNFRNGRELLEDRKLLLER